MGMFDYYQTAQAVACPRCGNELSGWQGKGGPCGLFLWREGVRHPVDQLVDADARLASDKLEDFALPEKFVIYTDCCGGDFLIDALGSSADGVWQETRLLSAEDIDEVYRHEPKARRKARKKWLAAQEGRRN